MAQIITDYDLSLGSTIVAAATSVNNIRFQYNVTGGDEGQNVYLYPVCSEDNLTFDEILKGNKTPFEFKIKGNEGDSERILSVGSATVKLKVVCDGCTGLLNVFTYED